MSHLNIPSWSQACVDSPPMIPSAEITSIHYQTQVRDLRPAWSTYRVPGQPIISKETLSQNKKYKGRKCNSKQRA